MTALLKVAKYWKQSSVHIGRLVEYIWYTMEYPTAGKNKKDF